VSNAYASYLMKRQYPFYVLYIDMPTEIVDVNVHPNKADVRFADNQTVYGCIYSVISAVLDGQPKALEYLVSDKTAVASEIDAEPEKVVSPKAAPVSAVPFSAPKKEKPRNAPLNNSAKGVVSFSYEDARRELEKVRPSKTTSMELPFEPEPKAEENAVPVQSVPAEKKSLRETYADLQVEKNILEVNSPEAAPAVKTEGNSKDFFAENKRFLEELETKAKQNKIDVSSCAYAGKLFNTYLLYERGDEVYIIDQHAAHERLIFDRLKEQMRTRKVLQQPMLLPYVLNLNAFESAFIREKMENIREMGFDIDEFGNNAFKVSAVPLDLQSIDLALFFNEILGDISGYRSIKLEDLLKDKLATAACKAAVKGGMDLTREETDRLFRLMDGNMGLKCPHGRPVVVKMTKTELEKMFKRIV